MHFLYASGVSPQTALRKLQKTYGCVLSQSGLYKLYGQFKEGRTEVKALPRSGRPTIENIDGPLESLIQQHSDASLEKLSSLMGIAKTTLWRRLKKMGYRKRRPSGFVNVPSATSRRLRLEVCTELLKLGSDASFLHRIVTCDERWILYSSREQATYWSRKGDRIFTPSAPRLAPIRLQVSLWWCRAGVLFCKFLEPDSTLTGRQHSAAFLEAVRVFYIMTGQPRPPLLLQDGVSAHTCLEARLRYREQGVRILPHPPHSPDLSPTDFCIFTRYNKYRKNHPLLDFTPADAQRHFLDFLGKLTPKVFKDGIDSLPNRWQMCIDSHGEFIIS